MPSLCLTVDRNGCREVLANDIVFAEHNGALASNLLRETVLAAKMSRRNAGRSNSHSTCSIRVSTSVFERLQRIERIQNTAKSFRINTCERFESPLSHHSTRPRARSWQARSGRVPRASERSESRGIDSTRLHRLFWARPINQLLNPADDAIVVIWRGSISSVRGDN